MCIVVSKNLKMNVHGRVRHSLLIENCVRAVTLMEEGHSQRYIAERLGVTKSAVSYVSQDIGKMGIIKEDQVRVVDASPMPPRIATWSNKSFECGH